MKTVRLALYFVVGLLLGGCFTLSYAGTFQSYQGSAFRNINGTTYWKGDATSFAASKATVLESLKVGGTYVTIPTFGQVTGAALAAVRMTPGLAGAALLSYLAGQGLELIADQWKKKAEPTAPVQSGMCSVAFGPTESTTLADCISRSTANMKAKYPSPWQVNYKEHDAASGNLKWDIWHPYGQYWYVAQQGSFSNSTPSCPAGSTLVNGMCQSSEYVPAGDSDWDRVRGVQPPAEVMADLCQRLAKLGTGCEVTAAGTLRASASLSDWSLNPTTGKDERQVATWTPRPSSLDPFSGELSVNTESKDPSAPTDPTTGNTTNPSDTTSQDNTKETPFCTLYPESLACAKMGTPEEAGNLDSKAMGVESITIQTFGSSATCPAPIPLPHGSELSFEWPCRMAEGVKPFLLALAWLAAGLIVIGAMRND